MTEEEVATRRQQIRSEVKALAEEYLQLWDEYEDSILVGYVVLAEAQRPDYEGRTTFDFLSEGFSPYTADGLCWNKLRDS